METNKRVMSEDEKIIQLLSSEKELYCITDIGRMYIRKQVKKQVDNNDPYEESTVWETRSFWEEVQKEEVTTHIKGKMLPF